MEDFNIRHLTTCQCPGCVGGGNGEAEYASLDPFAGQTFAMKPIFTAEQAGAFLNRTEWDWYTNNYGELSGTDNVLEFGFWNTFRDLANSYYLNDAGDTGSSEVNINTFSSFTGEQRTVARQSLELWDDLITVTFRETNAGAADITFGNTDTGGAQAYAYLPFGDIFDAETSAQVGPWEVGRLSGDVWIDGFVGSNFVPLAPSYYGYTTMIHELGHSLGLSHPGDYDALDDDDGDGVPDPITYANDAVYAQDSAQYSIMSYFDALETGAQHIDWSLTNFAYAATPLVHDVAGVQLIYGADMTTRTGDTVYGFNSTAGRAAFDFTVNTRPIVTIWDAGGTDTIDFSGFATRSTINLNAGTFSSGGGIEEFLTLEQVNANRAAIGFAPRSQAAFDFYEGLKAQLGLTSGLFTDNVAIAYGAVIENAVTGAGDDLIIVNDVANSVDGGAGIDTVSYESAATGVQAAIDGSMGRRGAFGDKLVNIENLIGSGFSDILIGNAGRNTLDGGRGNDRLIGGGDDDTFVFRTAGSTGTDRIADFAGGDVLVVDKALVGSLATSVNGFINLDTDGDKLQFENRKPSALRFLGEEEGQFYYGDAAVRPLANGSGQRVYESTVADDTITGSRSQAITDVFFYDTANAAPTSGDDVLTFTARDLFVTTTKIASDRSDNLVYFSDGELDLTGHGGTVSLRNFNGIVNALEFDGTVTRDGVDYFVYSSIGSTVGVSDLMLAGTAPIA